MSDNDAGDNNPTDRDESSETKEAPVEELAETVSEVIEVNKTLRTILGIQDTTAALNYEGDQ